MWKWSALNSAALHEGLPGRKQDDCWLLQKYPPYPDYSLLTGSEITYRTDHSASSSGSAEVAEYISTCLFSVSQTSSISGLSFSSSLVSSLWSPAGLGPTPELFVLQQLTSRHTKPPPLAGKSIGRFFIRTEKLPSLTSCWDETFLQTFVS